MSHPEPQSVQELVERCLPFLRAAQAAVRFEALVRAASPNTPDKAVNRLLKIVHVLSREEARLLDVWGAQPSQLSACLQDAARLGDDALELLVAEKDDIWEPEGATANLRRVGELLAPHRPHAPETTTKEQP